MSDPYGDDEDDRQQRCFWGYLLGLPALGGILVWAKTSWDALGF